VPFDRVSDNAPAYGCMIVILVAALLAASLWLVLA
jgi:hypothetical protein